MFRRPYQIWMVFLLALTLVCPAMIWLSVKAVQVDRARNELLIETELAGRNARQQDLVTAALWRMDSILTPLVGPEATRPYAYYQPFIVQPPTTKGTLSTVQVPSPLLESPSQFVEVHFQIDENGVWSSPQSPSGEMCMMAMQCGISEERIETSRTKLTQLSDRLDFAALNILLPEQSLRQYLANDNWLAVNPPVNRRQVLRNTADFGNSDLNRLRGYPTPQTANSINSFAANDQQQGVNQPPFPNEILPTDEEAQGVQQRESRPSQMSQQQEQSQVADLGRAGIDWIQRHQAYQSYTDSSLTNQAANAFNAPSDDRMIDEGVGRWLWLDGDLILARRVIVNGRQLVQGSWIDWPALKSQLLVDVSDLMEGIDLQPITNEVEVQTEMSLATIPVQLKIVDSAKALGLEPFDAESVRNNKNSPIRSTLYIAWISFFTATIAVGILLQGVIRLSERRGAFVSAVTHELRTPLTTFRMYAEMLSEDMVTDENKKKEYLSTLRIEADRLTHLVENVLAYSRLERGQPGGRRTSLTLKELSDRIEGRLADRASDSQMKLSIHLAPEIAETTITTDPGAIEQILFNLVENACKYGKSEQGNQVIVAFDVSAHHWCISVTDSGPGINPIDRRRLFEPFSKSVERAAVTAPGVGLGLALCRRLAQALGGKLNLLDRPDSDGACFELTLPRRPRS